MAIATTTSRIERCLATPVAAPTVRTRQVLQLITPSHMSGAEMQLVRLTRQMRARGHFMPILVKRGSPAVAEMNRLGANASTIGMSGKLNPLALPRIAAAVRRSGVELIQSTLSTASWWAGWLESVGGPKSIGHVQGFTSARWHRRQSHLLAVSGAVRDDLVRQGIAADRITVLYNALAPEEFVPQRSAALVRAELGADEDTPVVGTFGHLSIKKGYRDLFDAIPKIVERAPRTQFWIVGRGPLRTELEEAAAAGGFLRNIRLLGYRRDAADLMNAIDVMALPSHREPCALAYLEAALLCKPVVACRAGGAPESVADEETGLLVPVGNGNAIAEAVLALVGNRDVAERMGRVGFQRARDLFSW
jgi:glycosyltransferase involved in cell wall biosynthesis